MLFNKLTMVLVGGVVLIKFGLLKKVLSPKSRSNQVEQIFIDVDNTTENAKEKLQYKHASHMDTQIKKMRARYSSIHRGPIHCIIGGPHHKTRRARFDKLGHNTRTYKPGFIIN